MDDDLALPVLDDIRACLCAELADTVGGEVCFCSLMPGQSVPADFCTCSGGGRCGQAWTRVARIYPYAVFPQQDNTLQRCVAPMAATIELGVYRCMPTLTTGGAAPTAVQQTEATMVQLSDWQAMRRAVRCCEALEGRMTSLGDYQPRDLGACGGGVLNVTVQLGRVR